MELQPGEDPVQAGDQRLGSRVGLHDPGVQRGGQFFFEPVYAGCDHSGGTTVLNAKPQVCDRKGYTGDTACADCGKVIKPGSDIYPPANAGHTGTLQPLYYYGTANSATTDASHGGKRYNANSGDCRHRAYEGDYRCTACGGTVKGETGDFKHSGPFELRDVRTATCTEKGYSGNQYCKVCDRIALKGTSTKSLHEIDGNSKVINAVKPTCTAVGYSGDYQCTAGCGQIFRYGHVIDKLGHNWDDGKPATQGKSEGILYTCRRVGCDETKFVKGSATTEYSVTVSIDGNGTAMADKTSAAAGTVVTLSATPKSGYHFKQWQVITGGVTIKDNKFTMPVGNVEIKAIFEKNATPPPAPAVNPFVDVPSGVYYEEAVLWAVDKGITKGTDAPHFSPNGICTRAQAVTFLWRAAGSPAAKSGAMPFTDVKAGSYYETAVLWAVENGITKGTTATTFSPEQNCSRAQIVTFLWRSEKSPAAGTVNPFTDVKPGTYYADAVLWAVKEDVTKGTTTTTFSPNDNCTRAQIVTFLYRAMK